ncbi:hypothetical protein CR513_57456, partial [Mucuna pruriens]
MFTLKEHKTNDKIFGQIQTILNDSQVFGNKFIKEENNMKLFDDLPKEFESQSTIIQEAHDLNILTLYEFLESLEFTSIVND